MAFTNFYIDSASGGSDLNAGTTTGAVAFTYAAGTFVRATGVFTVASGNPLSDGVTVGTYASVYTTSGAVAATFVAQVTARDATTITVDVTTLKWGVVTTVSETAAASTLKVSGSWVSELPLAAGGLATFTVPVSTKVNIKLATYTVVAARTISMAGATGAPLWFSGYSVSPGDLDNDTTNVLSKPTLAFNSTFSLVTSGNFQTWSSVSVTGAFTGALWSVTGQHQKHVRCRSNNSSANVAANALTVSGAGGIIAYGYYVTPTTATTTGTVALGNTQTFIGCISEGGGVAGFNCGGNTGNFFNCVCFNNTGSGILATDAKLTVQGCTFYGATVNGIKWTSEPFFGTAIIGCLFSGVSGGAATTNGINSGVTTNVVLRACNDYYNVTNPEVNFGDSPAFFGQTDSAFPLTSVTNMTPIATSNAANRGFPGIFESKTYSGYTDVGAVEPASAAGGGESVAIFGG